MSDIDDFQIELGMLHLQIEGKWSVQDFAQLLEDIRHSYQRLNTIEFFAQAIQGEQQTEQQAKQQTKQFKREIEESYFRSILEGNRRYGVRADSNLDEHFEFLVSVAHRHTGDLYIKSIVYNSPGWLEIIGSWNPLKIIADGITSWRHENTERQKIAQQGRTDEMKIRSGLAREVIKSAKVLRELEDSEQIERLLEFVLTPTEKTVKEIAKDTRMVDVKMLPPSSH